VDVILDVLRKENKTPILSIAFKRLRKLRPELKDYSDDALKKAYSRQKKPRSRQATGRRAR
jgi:hypothetical protein